MLYVKLNAELGIMDVPLDGVEIVPASASAEAVLPLREKVRRARAEERM